jgi:hypothetical protein
MRHTGTLIALLSTVAIVGTTAANAWPVMTSAPAPADSIILAQMGGMGGMGGGMGGMGGMGGGMGGMGGGMGGMGGGGMGGMGGGMSGGMGGMGGGMSGGGMGGMSGGGMGGMGGGMRGDGGMGGMGGMGGNNRNRNVNVNRSTNVYVRGVRPWSSRAWYGTAIAGVTLGTILAVSAVPPVPDDRLCWFWVDSSERSGYWDWCVPPM